MLYMLAQARPAAEPVQQRVQEWNLFETVNSVFSRADTLAHPRNLVDILQNMSIVWAVVFLIAGLVCMLNGFKLYKWVTVILALCIGGCVGYYLGKKIDAQYIVAASLGALLAVCAWPLMKYAIAVMGGLVGMFLGANIWGACAGLTEGSTRNFVADTYWVGALMGLIFGGLLAFIVFKLTIILFTSISGATVAMIGILALILQVQPWQQSISNWSENANSLIFPLLVVVPAIIGLIMQQTSPETGRGSAGSTSLSPSKSSSPKPAASS